MSKETVGRFIEYFSKPLNNEQLIYLNNLNRITTEKVELYSDFIISLSHIVCDTYLGSDVINGDGISIHFKWCWLRTIENFERENIFFAKNGIHYNYFLNYFIEVFYESESPTYLVNIHDYWVNIFALNKNKTKSEYDMFIEVYRLLGKFFLNELEK